MEANEGRKRTPHVNFNALQATGTGRRLVEYSCRDGTFRRITRDVNNRPEGCNSPANNGECTDWPRSERNGIAVTPGFGVSEDQRQRVRFGRGYLATPTST